MSIVPGKNGFARTKGFLIRKNNSKYISLLHSLLGWLPLVWISLLRVPRVLE